MLTIQAIIAVQPSGAKPTGIMKMPDPIIPPTTKAVAIQKPNGRLIAWSSTVAISALPALARTTARNAVARQRRALHGWHGECFTRRAARYDRADCPDRPARGARAVDRVQLPPRVDLGGGDRRRDRPAGPASRGAIRQAASQL